MHHGQLTCNENIKLHLSFKIVVLFKIQLIDTLENYDLYGPDDLYFSDRQSENFQFM